MNRAVLSALRAQERALAFSILSVTQVAVALSLNLVLVVYYVFMARTILQMLRVRANPALLVFALLGLIPFPPTVIMGIVLMIIWTLHNKATNSAP